MFKYVNRVAEVQIKEGKNIYEGDFCTNCI